VVLDVKLVEGNAHVELSAYVIGFFDGQAFLTERSQVFPSLLVYKLSASVLENNRVQYSIPFLHCDRKPTSIFLFCLLSYLN
jgi:hypothetical protein